MEVFYVIDRPVWQRGLLAILLVVAVGVFYVMSKVQESSGSSGIDLVWVAEDAAPASGEILVLRPAEPADEPIGQEEAKDVEVTSNGSGVSSPDAGFTEASEEEFETDLGTPALSLAGEAPAVFEALGGQSPRFDAFRIAKTTGRSRRLEALERSLERDDLTEAAREAVHAEWLALVERDELEKQAEGLLIARGLSDALVLIQDDAAEVVVPEVIDQQDAGRIGDLIARIAGVSLDRITIVDGASVQ